MSFGPPTGVTGKKWSTWTPLNNEGSNNKIFEERKALIGKWYEKWSDDQRRKILEEMLIKSSPKQLQFAADLCQDRIPAQREDFTRVLPRVVSLYVLSYLDPRTLSRAVQVCWHWKALAESDSLWMPRCVRLGWQLPFAPSPFEAGLWKRHYIENIVILRRSRPRDRVELTAAQLDGMKVRRDKKSDKVQPWRGSDKKPVDIHRYNYLDNSDTVLEVQDLRRKGVYGQESEELTRNAKPRTNTGLNRSESLGVLGFPTPGGALQMTYPGDQRPGWAKPSSRKHVTHDVTSAPAPVTGGRSHRDLPTSDTEQSRPRPLSAQYYSSRQGWR